MLPRWQRAFSLKELGLPGGLQLSQFHDWLFTDVAFLHASLAVSASVQDFLLQRGPSKTTSLHLRKSAARLNRDLSAGNSALGDGAISTIMALWIASCFSLDQVAMAAHGDGLRNMVRLRGGLDSFRHYPQMVYLMARWVGSFLIL